ncbi:MAG: SRPBCC family protein [Flavobacteriales bacterium]|jgi:ligand-binding SRPBCC domain-containing protein
MKVYTLRTETTLPCSLDAAWDFFSTPLNLNRITPPDMSFEILSDLNGVKMYPGMVIHYKVRPLMNIPLRWTTEITHCVEGKFFVDEQRFGPYAFWHHQHHFEAVTGGVTMTDIVNYAIGFGPIGALANAVYVENRLKEIFAFREKAVAEIFGKK